MDNSVSRKWAKINKRFALLYLSLLVSVQVIGILIVLRSPTFLSLIVAAVMLGTVWPIVLHQVLYRTLLKRWTKRISDS